MLAANDIAGEGAVKDDDRGAQTAPPVRLIGDGVMAGERAGCAASPPVWDGCQHPQTPLSAEDARPNPPESRQVRVEDIPGGVHTLYARAPEAIIALT